MKNNLQANLLRSSNSIYFVSEQINLTKKQIKELKIASWLKLEQEFLNIVINSSNKALKGKLFGNKEYLFIEKNKNSLSKYKIKKEYFSIKYNLEKELQNTITAIAKMPINATLLKGKKEFAKIDLYITDNIFIEIKELI